MLEEYSLVQKEQKFYVTGTTCQSCEVVIEREVKKMNGVTGVVVSHTQQTLCITSDCPIQSTDISEMIGKYGYGLSSKPTESIKSRQIDWKKVGGTMVGSTRCVPMALGTLRRS